MDKNILKLPMPADPSIDQILDAFLAEQRERLKPKTVANYEDVLNLLRYHLNGYAYENLSEAESTFLDGHSQAKADEHREFCQLFGPDKIVENLRGFLGYFMVRKVVAGQNLKRAAGTVTKKLSRWMATKGYISEDEAKLGASEGANAARDLPNSERAAQILSDAAANLAIASNDFADQNDLEFGHYTIGKIEPGKLWLENFETGRKRPLGPVQVPISATKLLRNGWDISCSLGRVRGAWRIVEVANVYPF